MSGYLDARTLESRDYRKRYVILDHNSIKMYRKENERDVVSLLFAEDIHHIIDNTDDLVKHQFAFNIVTTQKTYVLNAPSQAKREEWKDKIRAVMEANNSDIQSGDLKYATVECFVGRGIRVNGEIGSVLLGQLTSQATKKLEEPRGTFYDCNVTVSSVLNIFSEHSWQMVSVFHTTLPHSLDSSPAPVDIIVFSQPVSTVRTPNAP
jgi:hypothetical protein